MFNRAIRCNFVNKVIGRRYGGGEKVFTIASRAAVRIKGYTEGFKFLRKETHGHLEHNIVVNPNRASFGSKLICFMPVTHPINTPMAAAHFINSKNSQQIQFIDQNVSLVTKDLLLSHCKEITGTSKDFLHRNNTKDLFPPVFSMAGVIIESGNVARLLKDKELFDKVGPEMKAYVKESIEYIKEAQSYSAAAKLLVKALIENKTLPPEVLEALQTKQTHNFLNKIDEDHVHSTAKLTRIMEPRIPREQLLSKITTRTRDLDHSILIIANRVPLGTKSTIVETPNNLQEFTELQEALLAETDTLLSND